MLGLAASAEYLSEHPLAGAIVEAARERGLDLCEAREFDSTPGVGVQATIAGARVVVGAPARLMADLAGPVAGHVTEAVTAVEQAGRTAVLVLRDGAPVGVLGIADRLRPVAAATVAALRRATGAPPVLLTGDTPRAAAALAAEVGIEDVRAALLPQDKVDAVRALQHEGQRVLLVGDGVNDAPALAAAHTGIAMGKAGSDLTLDTADAIIVRDELATLPTVIALSRRARRLS